MDFFYLDKSDKYFKAILNRKRRNLALDGPEGEKQLTEKIRNFKGCHLTRNVSEMPQFQAKKGF